MSITCVCLQVMQILAQQANDTNLCVQGQTETTHLYENGQIGAASPRLQAPPTILSLEQLSDLTTRG